MAYQDAKSAIIMPEDGGFLLFMMTSMGGVRLPFGAMWYATEAEAKEHCRQTMKIKPTDWATHEGEPEFAAAVRSATEEAIANFVEATEGEEELPQLCQSREDRDASLRGNGRAAGSQIIVERQPEMSLQDRFAQFREVLAASDPKEAAKLRPGLPRDVVQERLTQLQIKLPADVVELYTWANSAFREEPELLPGGYLMSFDDAVAEFEEVAPMWDELEAAFSQRYRHSFRFLSDGSDGGYSFCGVEPPGLGRVVHLCIHEPWLLAFESLDKLVETAIACRKLGVFRADDIPDFDLYYRIAKELNPGMENWAHL